MATKRDLKRILEDISEGAKFSKFDYNSPEHFSVMVKCKVDKSKSSEFYNQYASQWIKKFSKLTSTTWIVRSSFPNLKRLVYRKVYICHRSSFNKVKKPERGSTRNQDCKAKIDFKMKFTNRNTIKNDPLLREGLNMTIFVDFSHTHKIKTAESCNLLKCTADTDDTFYEYFKNGYTRGEAKNYHELTILDKYSDKNPDCLMNATINPSISHVFYLYAKKLKEGKLVRCSDDIMVERKAKIMEQGGYMSATENLNIVVIITPAMRRVIMKFELDLVLINSTPVPNGPIATFIYVQSVLGALPISCLLHTEQTEASYSQAFFTFKMLVENECNKNFDPKILLIDSSSEQRNALDAIFSTSKIISSHISMCNVIWRWLCDESNKIEARKRHPLMRMFDALLRASTLETFDQCYTALTGNDYVNSNKALADYTERLWQNKYEWVMLDDNNTCDNMLEISIRLMKEFIIRRCKSFTLGVMVDVISNIVDNHHCKILNAYLNNQNVVSAYTRFLPKVDTVSSMEVNQTSANEFRIVCHVRPKKYATFRIDTWCCDCMRGSRGQFCEHLCGILNSNYEITNVLPDDARSVYFEIAGEAEVSDAIKPEIMGSNHGDVSVSTDDYFFMEVKKEMVGNEDPLDEDCNGDNEVMEFSGDDTLCGIEASSSIDWKVNYANAFSGLNDEFRRLNGYFKKNVNRSNMETMMRLAKELSKIRPVERVNLKNMNITLNDDAEKLEYSDD